MKPRTFASFLIVALIALVTGLAPAWLDAQPTVNAASSGPVADGASFQSMNCTFTVTVRLANLRDGPGTEYDKVGSVVAGDTINVTGQGTGEDGYVWWQFADGWIRSDLGDSDCPSTCGNDVCEYDEDISTCAADCTSVPNLVSYGEGCVVEDCRECYESISCWPDCSGGCQCFLNVYGCVTCECDDGEDAAVAAEDVTSVADDTVATGISCVYDTCQECIDAFPCIPGPCTVQECELNEFGCPVCQTSS